MENKREFLEENVVGNRLKQYFTRMEKIYGEDVATETALSGLGIKDGLRNFSDGFDEFSDFDINIEILKICILSDRPYDTALKYANTAIEQQRIEQLIMDMETNPILKRAIVENYVRNAYSTTQQMYERAQNSKYYRPIDGTLEILKEAQEKHNANKGAMVQNKKVAAKVKSFRETDKKIPVSVGENE